MNKELNKKQLNWNMIELAGEFYQMEEWRQQIIYSKKLSNVLWTIDNAYLFNEFGNGIYNSHGDYQKPIKIPAASDSHTFTSLSTTNVDFEGINAKDIDSYAFGPRRDNR